MSFVISTVLTAPQTLNGGTAGVILPGGAVVGGALFGGTVNVRTDGDATLHVDGAIINTLDDGSTAPGIDVRNAASTFDTLAGSFKLYVGDTGVVSSANGYGLSGSAVAVQVTNHGEIYGADRAIVTHGRLELNNTGDISSNSFAIENFGGSGTSFDIVNSGTISTTGGTVMFTSGTLALRNSGYITSAAPASVGTGVGSGSQNDTVWNTGTIDTRIDLRAGNDAIFNAGTITGRVILGDGDDRLTNEGTILDDVFMNSGSVDGGSGTLVNSGTIAGLVYNYDFDLDVQNTGTLQSGILDLNGTLFNGGFIGEALQFNSPLAVITMEGTLTNTGTIVGDIDLSDAVDVVENAATGIITGDVDLGAGNDDLTNSGTITGQIVTGTGANVLINTGTMTYSSSMVIDARFAASLRLDNAGLIVSTSSPVNTGIAAAFGDDVVTNSGTIDASIALLDGDDDVTNTGTITGRVSLGDGDDTLMNEGTILGDVFMDSSSSADGDDALINSGVIAGLINALGNPLDVLNTGEIQAGITSMTGDVFNAGIIGGNVEFNLFNPVLTLTGSLTNTHQILGQVTTEQTGIIENSGTITGGIFHNAGNFDLKNTGLVDGLYVSASFATVENGGTLTGSIVVSGDSGIDFSNAGSMGGAEIFGMGATQFSNSGTVEGFLAIDGIMSTVLNTGQILGDAFVGNEKAFDGTRATTSFDNFGLITGDATMQDAGGSVYNDGTIGVDVLLSNTGTSGETFRMGDTGSVGGSVFGLDGDDFLFGGQFGDDELRGGTGIDQIYGQAGDDEISGGSWSDMLSGGTGEDILLGGGGADRIFGGNGNDELDGGGQGDTLAGGRGDDILTGGGGADTFVFGRMAGNDVITDFGNGADNIDLSAYGLNGGDVTAAGDISAAGTAAVVDLTLLGGRGEIIVTGMAGTLVEGDFIL